MGNSVVLSVVWRGQKVAVTMSPAPQEEKVGTPDALREEAKLQPDVWVGLAVLLVLLGMMVIATAWFMGGL